jgi:arsenate reductase
MRPDATRGELVRVLFLCTHNSARSQMAEAILRDLGGEGFVVESAGTHPRAVHPLAAETMARRGIDLARHRSRSVEDLAGREFDYVITVCDAAHETCPIFTGAPHRIHWSTLDPSAIGGTEAERAAAFEKAANELTERISALFNLGQARSRS